MMFGSQCRYHAPRLFQQTRWITRSRVTAGIHQVPCPITTATASRFIGTRYSNIAGDGGRSLNYIHCRVATNYCDRTRPRYWNCARKRDTVLSFLCRGDINCFGTELLHAPLNSEPGWFLQRVALFTTQSAVIASANPSVCPSHTGTVSKRRKLGSMWSSPADSPGTLAFLRDKLHPDTHKETSNGRASNESEYRTISETVGAPVTTLHLACYLSKFGLLWKPIASNWLYS